MSDTALLLIVLAAALFHASWNALLKSSKDGFNTMIGIDLWQLAIAVIFLPFVALPAAAAWPYIVASAIIHIAYRLMLLKAYEYGDLSRAYPIARGSAPILVTVFGFFLFETGYSVGNLAGIGIVSAGIMSLALARTYGLRAFDRGVAYALGTGMVIAAYSVVDAIGVRLSGAALGYIIWLFFIDSIPLGAYALVRQRRNFGNYVLQSGRRALYAGVLSMAGYGIIIWCFTRGSVAEIVAVRETSVVFAALIGALFLGEGFGPRRAISAAIVAIGIIVLKVAG